MALSGLDIYKLLPRTNCKECGYATCLAFAMALAQKKISLDKCPHVSTAAKEALEGASRPPIRLVTVGNGANKLEVGNETVMFRHEQKFYHPAGIGLLLEDSITNADMDKWFSDVRGLAFERIGIVLRPDIVCIKNSSRERKKFRLAVEKALSSTDLNIALYADDEESLGEAVKSSKAKRPLLICDVPEKLDYFVGLAKENGLPLAVTVKDLNEAADYTKRANSGGVEEVVINIKPDAPARTIELLTYTRRLALKKNFRPLGFPLMTFVHKSEGCPELAEALSYVLKYSGIVVVDKLDKDFIFPLLVARQDIYSDPQKPVQVEPKIYEIGKVTAASPVAVTTNFSITYFTVAGEIESSKVPTYLVCCDAEGMSVLTGWAAEKFTPEKISDTLKKSGIEGTVSHRNVIIPGYVAVMSSKLEEISGWKVLVGPREASGIPSYFKGLR